MYELIKYMVNYNSIVWYSMIHIHATTVKYTTKPSRGTDLQSPTCTL